MYLHWVEYRHPGHFFIRTLQYDTGANNLRVPNFWASLSHWLRRSNAWLWWNNQCKYIGYITTADMNGMGIWTFDSYVGLSDIGLWHLVKKTNVVYFLAVGLPMYARMVGLIYSFCFSWVGTNKSFSTYVTCITKSIPETIFRDYFVDFQLFVDSCRKFCVFYRKFTTFYVLDKGWNTDHSEI